MNNYRYKRPPQTQRTHHTKVLLVVIVSFLGLGLSVFSAFMLLNLSKDQPIESKLRKVIQHEYFSLPNRYSYTTKEVQNDEASHLIDIKRKRLKCKSYPLYSR